MHHHCVFRRSYINLASFSGQGARLERDLGFNNAVRPRRRRTRSPMACVAGYERIVGTVGSTASAGGNRPYRALHESHRKGDTVS